MTAGAEARGVDRWQGIARIACGMYSENATIAEAASAYVNAKIIIKLIGNVGKASSRLLCSFSCCQDATLRTDVVLRRH